MERLVKAKGRSHYVIGITGLGTTPVGLGTLFVTITIGGLIIIRTFLKRHKTRKQEVSDFAAILMLLRFMRILGA